MEQMAAVAVRLEALEEREAQREAVYRIICGGEADTRQPMELVYNAGGVTVRRRLGSGTGHAAETPRPWHLHAVRGDR